jgi:bifunctional non-homologous end joining protein LigD
VFKNVINRLMSSGETTIQKMTRTKPCYCYVFDCLYLDGRALINEPLTKRKEWLRDAIRPDTPYRISEFVEDGHALFEAARQHGLEGIMAKRRDSKYLPGRRSDSWYKVKIRQTSEVFVVGYTQGKGGRGATFGALHVAEKVGDKLQYRGKVGTGFDDATMREILKLMKKAETVEKPSVEGNLLDVKTTVWLAPTLIAEVSYASLTSDKIFREPVFVRIRPDISPLES